jgi:hypothetical protein
MNLTKYSIDLETGVYRQDIKEDVTVVDKTKVVRKQSRAHDLRQGLHTLVSELNIVKVQHGIVKVETLGDDLTVEIETRIPS